MDGFKNITISNFRGIDHLTMENFARVNILVGQNNCGKSTVLEALLFATGMSNPFWTKYRYKKKCSKTQIATTRVPSTGI